jgi:pimeloyl-ACP methyl ester carboxylesterase
VATATLSGVGYEASPVRYAKNGDVHIAYRLIGDVALDLIHVAGAITHLNLDWEEPSYRRFSERLAGFSRLINFDKSGMGLSDRVAVGTLEERMEDATAVLNAAGSNSAALLGVSEGGPMAMLFAAAHPERTRALILCGAEVRERKDEDWPWGESTPEEFEEAMASLPERGDTRILSLITCRATRTMNGPCDWPSGKEWRGPAQVRPSRSCGWLSKSTSVTLRARFGSRH